MIQDMELELLLAWAVWSWSLTSGSGTTCKSCGDDRGEGTEAIVSGIASDGEGVSTLVDICSATSGFSSGGTGSSDSVIKNSI